MDTDSFTVYIKTDDFCKDIAEDAEPKQRKTKSTRKVCHKKKI